MAGKMRIKRYNESEDLGFDVANISFDYEKYLNKIEVYELQCWDLDNMVMETYGVEYDSREDEQDRLYEASLRYNVDGILHESYKKSIINWRNGGENYVDVNTILDSLCSDGLIPPGIYYMSNVD